MCWECLHFTIALWLLFPSLVFHRHGFFTALFMMQVDIFVSGKFKLEISRALNFFSSSNPITNKIAPLNYFCEWVDRARRKAVLIKWTNIKFRCQVHFDPYFKKNGRKFDIKECAFIWVTIESTKTEHGGGFFRLHPFIRLLTLECVQSECNVYHFQFSVCTWIHSLTVELSEHIRKKVQVKSLGRTHARGKSSSN